MTDSTYPLFPIFAFLGFLLALIPLPWHLQAWNSGTCYYMMWAALACLNQFVNSVVWHGNALNPSPVWCDISIRIMMGASVGLPAASLCINRRLYHIANVQIVSISRADKFRAVLIDSLICVLFPLIFIALQYVVQGHRFNIFEDMGCYPAFYNTLLAYFISSMWPIIIGLTSAVYCVLSLRAFAQRRLDFSLFMNSNKTPLTMSRYFRLMALATTEILFTTPLAIFTIWLNATAQPIDPWRSWADTHFDYSRVEQFPAFIWRRNHLVVVGMEFTRWVLPICALIFFAFFGFADEAKKNYRKIFSCFGGRVGFQPKKHPQFVGGIPSIGHYSKPRSDLPIISLTRSNELPPFPPSSMLCPMSDIKRTDSTATDEEALRYSAHVKDKISISSIGQVSSPNEHSQRFSWKSLQLPKSNRRYSSYI